MDGKFFFYFHWLGKKNSSDELEKFFWVIMNRIVFSGVERSDFFHQEGGVPEDRLRQVSGEIILAEQKEHVSTFYLTHVMFIFL